MSEICFQYDGEVQNVKLTDDLRHEINNAGGDIPRKSELELKERVEDLLYDLVEVTPRGCNAVAEVEVRDSMNYEASIDHGQTQKIDEADDVVITMIRPDRFVIGWSEDQ